MLLVLLVLLCVAVCRLDLEVSVQLTDYSPFFASRIDIHCPECIPLSRVTFRCNNLQSVSLAGIITEESESSSRLDFVVK